MPGFRMLGARMWVALAALALGVSCTAGRQQPAGESPTLSPHSVTGAKSGTEPPAAKPAAVADADAAADADADVEPAKA